MGFVVRGEEPSDFWTLRGVDDPATPPSVARVLNTVGTREEWRRAGVPVLFDADGQVRHVLRAGREYRFEHLGERVAGGEPHCQPLGP
jgi:hypothetical protein